MSEISFEENEEVQLGEEYMPRYICVKKEVPEEEICESETTSCSEARTTTGNILERIICDPTSRRPPCLGKWPSYPPKSEIDFHDNNHQFRAAQHSNHLTQMCSLRITSEPNVFRQPAIVGTIGPATSDVTSIGELLEAGMNIARLNMAHADPCSVAEPIRNIIEASNRFRTAKDYEIPIAIMMDLKGPEIRTGKIKADQKNVNKSELHIKENTFVRLTSDRLFEEKCTEKIIYIDYAELINQVDEGMYIYISDGEIKLRVDSLEETSIVCLVEVEGLLKNYQKVHVPGLIAEMPSVSEFDKECLKLAVDMNVDIVVVPKTRCDEMVQKVKKILREIDEENNILLLAKLSNYEGLENIDGILEAADGIVIQKNDLSLEISPQKMFIAQKEIIAKCNRIGKPVFCTGQLSFPKTSQDILRRFEMNDIGGAIVDGADGIILIKETATGERGVEAVTQLSYIMREAEAATMQKPFYFDLVDEQKPSIEPIKAIALTAVHIANKIQASAILAITTSGRTAQLLSWFRPRCPVIAITRVGKIARQLNLWRAVLPLHFTAPVLPDWFHDVKARFEYGISYGKDCGIIASGDLLVIVSGYRKNSGFTNSIRIVFASLEKDKFLDNVSRYYADSSK